MSEHAAESEKDHLVENLDDLYENAPCGYVSMRADGVIVKVNRTLCNWLSTDSTLLLGKHFFDLLSVPGKIFFETHFAPLLRMQGYFNEVAVDLAAPHGKYIPVLANAIERKSDDGSLLFTRVTLFKAIERRRYERELVEARNAAEVARLQLQETNRELEAKIAMAVSERLRLQEGLIEEQEVARLREQFVAILGHDLRNPLSSIVGGLNLLSKEPQTEKTTRVIGLMKSSARRMFGLIDDVLDFTRLRSGAGISLRLEHCRLGPILEQVVDELRTAHPDRKIESKVSLSNVVYCDPARIAQVLSNLIANALTHGDQAGSVRVATIETPDYVTLAVSNSGEPIPEDIKKKLFQPFFRADIGNEGLGLGLYISYGIVAGHGGNIEASSIDRETTFSFNLPWRAT